MVDCRELRQPDTGSLENTLDGSDACWSIHLQPRQHRTSPIPSMLPYCVRAQETTKINILNCLQTCNDFSDAIISTRREPNSFPSTQWYRCDVTHLFAQLVPHPSTL
jgi:hypothetical protein